MFSRIVQHVNAGMLVAFIALILSMAGGAFALGGPSGSGPAARSADTAAIPPTAHNAAKKSKKKSSGSVGPRGARGPVGPAGAAGPAGSAGPTGAAGPKGDTGAAGANGTNGNNGGPGESVTVGTPAASECEGRGGATVSNASGKETACNGETGFTSTLPSGKTEAGTWAAVPTAANEEGSRIAIPISFPIPLKSEESKTEEPVIEEGNVHFFNKGEVAAPGDGCGEGSAANPEAEPGDLCVYIAESEVIQAENMLARPASFPGLRGAGATGFVLILEALSGSAGIKTVGTWAVTAR